MVLTCGYTQVKELQKKLEKRKGVALEAPASGKPVMKSALKKSGSTSGPSSVAQQNLHACFNASEEFLSK